MSVKHEIDLTNGPVPVTGMTREEFLLAVTELKHAAGTITRALDDLATNGLLSKNGASLAARQVAASGGGLTVTNGDGVSGNPTLSLADDLAALEALAAAGIPYRTGTSAWAIATAAELRSLAADTETITAAGAAAAAKLVSWLVEPASTGAALTLGNGTWDGQLKYLVYRGAGTKTYVLTGTNIDVTTSITFSATERAATLVWNVATAKWEVVSASATVA